MRPVLRILLFAGFALAAPLVSVTSHASAGRQPTCLDLNDQRDALLEESKGLTSQVEAKNIELGEATDALSVAGEGPRKRELTRRVEGLRRELSTLLDRENESVNRLGGLDAEITKRCRTSGGK